MGSKIAAALLGAVTTAALDAALLSKADASALAARLSTVDGLDTPLEVDTKIANALLGLATEAFVAAQLASWELVRGSNVVRNLHLGAPLSAALANGDDTLSITVDCYSTAGTDAAITAALLAYYTLAQVDALLGDDRTGAAQDAETTSAITGALLAYYTSAQVDALLGDYRTASAQDTQTQAAIAGALLAYRTGPDQDVFATNQITSALVAHRSAETRTRQRPRALQPRCSATYYTIAQVDGLLAGKLGVVVRNTSLPT